MKIAIVVVVFLVVMTGALFVLSIPFHYRGTALAGGEIRMLSHAIENYKNDRGHYPTDPGTSERLKPNSTFDSADYVASSAFLYRAFSGGETGTISEGRNYLGFDFPSRWLRKSPSGETYFVDEWWGHCLGYSTFHAVHPESPEGNNLYFDLWSTGGHRRQSNSRKWIKNW